MLNNIKIGIYKITNLINSKVYIGQSKNIYKRWYSHRCDYKKKNLPLYYSMRKYGIENFSFEIIEECQIDQLSKKEDYWINNYNSYVPNGYNVKKAETHSSNISIPEKYLLIIKDIEESPLLLKEIAEKYHMSTGQIGRINNGRAWRLQDKQYPLRGHPPIKIEIIKDMLKENLTLSQIAEALSVSTSVLKYELEKNNQKVLGIREKMTSNKRIFMKNLNGEIIKNFISAKSAAEYLKELNEDFENLEIDSYRIAILRHSKNKKPYKGFLWDRDES